MNFACISSRLPSRLLLAGMLLGTAPAYADSLAVPTGTVARPAADATRQPTLLKRGIVRTSKTDLGLRIDYAFAAPAVGSATGLQLTVAGNTTGRALTVEVRADDALRIISGMPGGRTLQTAATAEHVLNVVALREGLHYLHVFVQAGDLSEALAIALPVGKNRVSAKPVSLQTMPDGRRIRAIPAQP